jgi:hypothetical protein
MHDTWSDIGTHDDYSRYVELLPADRTVDMTAGSGACRKA